MGDDFVKSEATAPLITELAIVGSGPYLRASTIFGVSVWISREEFKLISPCCLQFSSKGVRGYCCFYCGKYFGEPAPTSSATRRRGEFSREDCEQWLKAADSLLPPLELTLASARLHDELLEVSPLSA